MKAGKALWYVMALVFLVPVSSCTNDNTSEEVKESSDVSKFIWYGLHNYYLWYTEVPELQTSKYKTLDDLYRFLNQYTDYEQLFYRLLYRYGTVDKWSFIVDDYTLLEQILSGISKSMGFDFILYKMENSDDLFGVVRYVLEGSPADLAGIKRGDIFIRVNGQDLTVSNYRSLLFGLESYSLSFAYIEGDTIYPNNVTRDLTAVEIQEDPVYYWTVLDLNGVPTGYLVYNAFTSDFDGRLNDVFGDMKTAGVQKLILDLRYNGGGAITSAINLASMIYTTDESNLFSRISYNDKLQAYITGLYGDEYFNVRFTDSLLTASDANPTVPINTLNLADLYVITTNGTASSSELLINGLEPYMNVTVIGEDTYGKYVGSITLKDYDNNGTLNPSHKWGMQPIVLKIANSEGVSDYVNGLPADEKVSEDIAIMRPFGDVNETLLAAAISRITGAKKSGQAAASSWQGLERVADSKDLRPFGKEMYLNGIPRIINSR